MASLRLRRSSLRSHESSASARRAGLAETGTEELPVDAVRVPPQLQGRGGRGPGEERRPRGRAR
ncbi:hypothetical protein SALBM311S_07011 [Streptomyces alboniger]